VANVRRHPARPDGFTLVELLVVMAIIGALLAIAIPSYLGARGRATNRVAQSDLRAAIPSAESYQTDHADYSGLDLSALRATDSGLAASIDHVGVLDGGSGYCLGATVDTVSWSLRGPGAKQWYASDDCASGTEATP
jgi:prepilin-type N-terminal cleavage/methylation domain-containing protein